VPDYVRKQTREKTLLKLKKKMAQMHTSKKSGRRVVLLAEADALIAVMGTSKTKGKAVQSDDEEADVVEIFLTATPSALATKLKKPTTSAKNRFGKLRLVNAIKAKSGAMKKVGKKAEADKSAEIKDKNQTLLAVCTVQRFAGYAPPPVFGR
jgi:hypothetical protein